MEEGICIICGRMLSTDDGKFVCSDCRVKATTDPSYICAACQIQDDKVCNQCSRNKNIKDRFLDKRQTAYPLFGICTFCKHSGLANKYCYDCHHSIIPGNGWEPNEYCRQNL